MIVLAVAIGGCGGGSSPPKTTTTTAPSTTSSTTTTLSSLSSPSSVTATSSASVTTTSAAGGELQQFQLPSGNIGCYIDANGVRCDIRERIWQPPAKPASCDVDYGQGIELRDGRAAFVCAGDTTLGGGVTLAYGTSIERGSFRCDSSAGGVECKDSRSGHGFHLSRASYRIF
jgi:hypothetical protein